MIRVWKGVSRDICFEFPQEHAGMDKQELIKKLDLWTGKKGVNQPAGDPVPFGALAFDLDDLCFVNAHLYFNNEERVFRGVYNIIQTASKNLDFMENLQICVKHGEILPGVFLELEKEDPQAQREYQIACELVRIAQDEPCFIEELRGCLEGPPEVALERLRDSLR